MVTDHDFDRARGMAAAAVNTQSSIEVWHLRGAAQNPAQSWHKMRHSDCTRRLARIRTTRVQTLQRPPLPRSPATRRETPRNQRAERAGFEPAVQLLTGHVFSKDAHSTTLPPLRHRIASQADAPFPDGKVAPNSADGTGKKPRGPGKSFADYSGRHSGVPQGGSAEPCRTHPLHPVPHPGRPVRSPGPRSLWASRPPLPRCPRPRR